MAWRNKGSRSKVDDSKLQNLKLINLCGEKGAGAKLKNFFCAVRSGDVIWHTGFDPTLQTRNPNRVGLV